MYVSAEALGSRNARELLDSGVDEVLMPCIGTLEDAIGKAAKSAGHVTVHTPANRIADPEEVREQLCAAGVDSILLVSGNPGHGTGARALDELIDFFRKHDFHVSVGAYPEAYFRRTSAHQRDKSASILLGKQAAGAQRVITQASFSAGNMRKWLETVRARGMRLPIQIGVMAQVPGRTLAKIARDARAEIFANPGMHATSRENMDMMFRMFWSHVPRPETFIREVGALEQMNQKDGFHIFGYGTDISRLIAAGRSAGRGRISGKNNE